MAKLKLLLVGAGFSALLVLAGCGDDDSPPADEGDPTTDVDSSDGDAGDGGGDGGGGDIGGDGSFDRSSLPEDFPTELIPDGFDTASTLDLDGQYTVSFVSTESAADSIAWYTERIGEPDTAVEGDPGEFSATWQLESGWIVNVLGGPDESFNTLTKFAE